MNVSTPIPADPAASESRPVGARIILADDDESVRACLTAMLRRAGYQVRAAVNGREALKLHAEERPDLLITDLVMPDMEGIETIFRLRKQDPALKIIAISGGGRQHADDYLKVAKAAGVTGVLAKPFSPDKLLDLVHKALTS